MSTMPSGEERKVTFLGGATLDGAPIAYVVVWAAVITGLSFIPFSVILGAGGSFPLSQGIHGLVGWVLGPIAGGVATGVGTVLAVFLAPHTAGIPIASIYGATLGSATAGVMMLEGKRQRWWIVAAVWATLHFLLYVGRAIVINGVPPGPPLLASFIEWSAILLFVLPTRRLAIQWIRSRNIALLAVGLFLGSWMVSGMTHAYRAPIEYYVINFPAEVFDILIPIIPVENVFRSLTGAVIGTGVITGLRAIGLVKPTEASY